MEPRALHDLAEATHVTTGLRCHMVLNTKTFKNVYVCLFPCACIHVQCPWTPEEGVRPLGTWSGCERSHFGAGILCEQQVLLTAKPSLCPLATLCSLFPMSPDRPAPSPLQEAVTPGCLPGCCSVPICPSSHIMYSQALS